jgi:hypothetical protein
MLLTRVSRPEDERVRAPVDWQIENMPQARNKAISPLWSVLAALAGAAFGLAAVYLADRPGTAEKTDPGPSAMRADLGADGASVQWDGTAGGLEHGATLILTEDGAPQRFDLDPEAARSGRMDIGGAIAETHVALDAPGVHEALVLVRMTAPAPAVEPPPERPAPQPKRTLRRRRK